MCVLFSCWALLNAIIMCAYLIVVTHPVLPAVLLVLSAALFCCMQHVCHMAWLTVVAYDALLIVSFFVAYHAWNISLLCIISLSLLISSYL